MINPCGVIVAIDGVSRAAESAGVFEDDVVGTRIWEWNRASAGETLKANLCRALFEDGPVAFAVTSEVRGVEERWDVVMRRLSDSYHVLCVATQVFAGEAPKLNAMQQRIVRMLADDKSVEDVAKICRISLASCRSHLTRLRTKFGVHTSHGLVIAAARFGLL